jgi:hypothetical protein
MSPVKKYGYLWVTLGFFLISLAGHWIFAWFAYVDEQRERGAPIEVGQYAIQTSRDTLENWQSEFLQLIWQVAGLPLLLFIGSPQSKEGSERTEEKIDHLLKKLDPENADRLIRQLEKKYPQK